MKLLFKFSPKYRRAMRIKKALLKAKEKKDKLDSNSYDFLMQTGKKVKSCYFFRPEDLFDCSALIKIKPKKGRNGNKL